MTRFAIVMLLGVIAPVVSAGGQPAPTLQIVVIEGEGAVNIIAQKTAVASLVEVRDRNNLPVTGASVTFTIGGGENATFAGGARALTVTTDAAGRAKTSEMNLLRSGKFQIQVQASYQGQVATAAISQTTVATAAAAAAIAGGAVAGGAATGGAATGGVAAGGAAAGGAAGAGGISATTIGIVGAAVGGGVIAASQVVGDESDGSGGSEFSSFSGPLSGQLLFTTVSSQGNMSTCVWTRAVSGTMKMDFKNADHAVGNVNLQVVETDVSVTGTCILGGPATMFTLAIDATGGPGALTFAGVSQSSGGGSTTTHKVGFNGSLAGSTITGTLSIETTVQTDGTFPNGSGSTSLPVTLTQVN